MTVDDTSDAHDATPGDDLCATAGGTCTLRAALDEAQAVRAEAAVTLPAGVYVSTLGTFEYSNPPYALTVTGAGSDVTTIDANGASPGMLIGTGGTVTLHGLTLRNAGGTGVASDGMTIEASTIADNAGPGIVAGRAATITDSTISGNHDSGIVNSDGHVTMHRTRVVNNRAVAGAGYFASGFRATLRAEDCTFDGNVATGGPPPQFGDGGAIKSDVGSVRLDRSTVSNNQAAHGGGGAAVGPGHIVVVNSTFSGNQAANGGAIQYGSISGEAGVILLNATITANRSAQAGGIDFQGGRNFILSANSILAGNVDTSGQGPNCLLDARRGTMLRSAGYNLFGDLTGCVVTGDTTGDVSDDPMLGPLADNGGPTQTHALLPGSPGIDGGIRRMRLSGWRVPGHDERVPHDGSTRAPAPVQRSLRHRLVRGPNV